THSVVEYDLQPYHVEAVVTPPVCPSMTPSPDKAVNVATTSSNTGVVPQPQRITKPEPPKAFILNLVPQKGGLIKKMSPILNTPQKAQASIFRNLALRKPVVMAKKPVIQVPSIMVYEDEELEEEDAIERSSDPASHTTFFTIPISTAKMRSGDPLVLKTRKGRALRRGSRLQGRISMPGLEKDTVHARRFPVEETAPAASGSGMQEGDNSVVVDDVVYACAFHPSVDLQFHEPMSRQALEHLKLSALPPALASLSKPSTEMRNGHPAVFRAHSDLRAHILHVPNISLFSLSSRFSIPALTAASLVFLNSASSLGKLEKKPAPNARLAGMGNVLHDSMPWISVHYFFSAIFLDAKIRTFYNLAHSHMAERNKVVQELVDGLDSIASHEGGTAIIDTYAEVSDLIRSFIVKVGKDASDSGSEGGADNA
ncbi:uncharacterized protein EV420DRAFT_1486229, partial [Desarmillaria tabescens]